MRLSARTKYIFIYDLPLPRRGVSFFCVAKERYQENDLGGVSARRSSPPKNPLNIAARALARTVPQETLFKSRTLGAVRNMRAPKKERGSLRGIESEANSPLKLLSLVTLLRNTKESNASPRQRQ